MIEINTAFHEDIYSLFSEFSKDSLTITAQDLLDIAAWVEQHREELTAQPHQPLAAMQAEIDRLRAENDALSSALSSLVKVVDANVPRHLVSFQQTLNAAKEALSK